MLFATALATAAATAARTGQHLKLKFSVGHAPKSAMREVYSGRLAIGPAWAFPVTKENFSPAASAQIDSHRLSAYNMTFV